MPKKTKFDVHVLLPSVPDAADACVRRIADALEAKTGIEAAHLVDRLESAPGQLCVHYDPDIISLEELRRFAHQAGAKLDDKYGHLQADTAPMRPAQAKRLMAKLSQTEGVLDTSVSPNGAIRVEFDRERTGGAKLASMLDELADGARKHAATYPAEHHDEEHAHGGIVGANTELLFVGLSGLTLLIGWLLSEYAESPRWLALSILFASYVFGGFFTLREAIANIRVRRFEIDSLMLVAAAGAAALGKWAEGALLLFLFSLGHALEHYAMGRAKRAIEALAELSPKTARVRRDG